MTPQLDQAQFDRVRHLVREVCGVVLSEGKEYLVEHRLGPLVARSGCADYDAFLALARTDRDGPWFRRLVDAITTHETSFFRDTHPFAAFANTILPWLHERIQERRSRPHPRRGPKASIWSVACSTGQEPYSLAMLFHEYLARARDPALSAHDLAIVGTDISTSVLATAVEGLFSDLAVGRGLSPQRRDRFFVQVEAGGWEVRSELRAMVDFRYHNLLENLAPLGGCDVIFCRNVLIYFAHDLRRSICERLCDALAPGGYLVLGAAESLEAGIAGLQGERSGQTMLYRRV